jgi:hypothetical protein
MSSLSLWESINLQRLLQKEKISEQHYIPGVPGKFRFRLGPGGWPLETVVVVVAGVAGWDVGGSAVLLPSPDDKLASPADALVMLDNVISSSSSGPPSFPSFPPPAFPASSYGRHHHHILLLLTFRHLPPSSSKLTS